MSEVKLGYRQRMVLSALRASAKPLPFGYLVRACDDGTCPSNYYNTHFSLRSLRERGLVRSPRRGYWEAA